ncbi:MAG: di-trans,poly-cis-decaprenylcistransferase [Dehalococcoidia bacterium]|nr:MAG: di-trans,poly-cis-decaprenylcistransferase [Dehalococcoidia bacterium]
MSSKVTAVSARKKTPHLPNHIAIIMDGNGRWAQQRGLPRLEGHGAGAENLRSVIKYFGRLGLKYLTLYGFSTENWKRPQEEIDGLLNLMQEALDKETLKLHKNGIRIRHLGRLGELSPGLQQTINKAVELTKDNTGMTFSLALNYGGRVEILDAVRKIIAEGVPPQKINEQLFDSYLYTAGLPAVDLVIRTAGELRISNFLIWQAAYSEYYFAEVFWPDFDSKEIDKALLAYSRRRRRFGAL